jgi:hypothetical protein
VKTAGNIAKAIVLVSAVLVVGIRAESKGPLELQHPTNVAGKTLSPGNYSVRWEGTGDQVELKVCKGKNVVASIPAQVIQLSSPPAYDSAVVNNDGNGTPSLAEIRFSGKKFALRISNQGGGSGSSGAAKIVASADILGTKGSTGLADKMAKRWCCLSSAICLRTSKTSQLLRVLLPTCGPTRAGFVLPASMVLQKR